MAVGLAPRGVLASRTEESMSVTGLVTGSVERAERVAELLGDQGVQVAVVIETDALDTADIPVGLRHYIQLPARITPAGDTAVARVGSFLTAGLLARFTAVERVLPLLAADATVVLVSGNTPHGVSLPDDQRSRLALLQLLAHATRAELATRNVRVEVVSAGRSDAEIVRYALSGKRDPDARLDAVSTRRGAAKGYEDWRTEVMGLVGIDL